MQLVYLIMEDILSDIEEMFESEINKVDGVFKRYAVKKAFESFNSYEAHVLEYIIRRYSNAKIAQENYVETQDVQRDISALGNFVYDWFAYLWRFDLHRTPDFDTFMKSISSTSKAGSISIWRWNYEPDPVEKWQTPKETYTRRDTFGRFIGDCDDIARFLLCGLNRNGHNAYLYAMWDEEHGHATCAVEEGEIETIGTFHRISHFTKDRKEVAEYWYNNLLGLLVYKQDPNTFELKLVYEYTNPENKRVGTNALTTPIDRFVKKMKKLHPESVEIILQTIDESVAREIKKELGD